MTRAATALAVLLLAIPMEARTIAFAGIDWQVRESNGPPGTRCWSASDKSVFVDESGALHLRIRRVADRWCQAEVRALASLRDGSYGIRLVSHVGQLPAGAVVGLFLYDARDEIDIELTASFGRPDHRGWYTIHAGSKEVAQESFAVDLSGSHTSHRIERSGGTLSFASWHGHTAAPPGGGLIHSWSTIQPKRLQHRALQPRINFWLRGSTDPGDTLEIVIRDVSIAHE